MNRDVTRSRQIARAAIAAALSVLAGAHASLAQIEWLTPEGNANISFEASAGSFNTHRSGTDYRFPTGAGFLGVRSRLGAAASLVIEVPMFSTRSETWYLPSGSTSDSRVGMANPYFGMEISRPGTSALESIGIRIPVLNQENREWAYPALASESPRLLAFAADMTQVSIGGGYRYLSRSGSGLRVTGGAQVAVPSKGYDPEVLGELATQFWVREGRWRLLGTCGGLVLLTESGIPYGERLVVNLGFAADVRLGSFQPGIQLRLLPENFGSDFVNYEYGVHVALLLPTTRGRNGDAAEQEPAR